MRHLDLLGVIGLSLWIFRAALHRWINRPLTPVDDRLDKVDAELLLGEQRRHRLG